MNKKKRELEQNELADALGTKIDEWAPMLPKIGVYFGVFILLIIAVAFWINTRANANAAEWREYFVSSRIADSRAMQTVAEYYPNSTVGTLALINAGDADYANGSQNVIQNRENYLNQVKQSIENYELALKNGSADKFERARATYALGYSFEAIGRFDEAKKMYGEIVQQMPETPEGDLAAKALKRVDNPKLTAIFAAYNNWVPPTESAPGETGTMLPVRPDITLPTPEETSDENKGADEAPPATESEAGEPTEPTSETPASGEESSESSNDEKKSDDG